jgi:hypothetical protein
LAIKSFFTALFCLLLQGAAFGQYPDPRTLNTAANGATTKWPIGSIDPNWYAATGDINGPVSVFTPAYVCGNCEPMWWYNSPFPNAQWITYNGGSGCQHFNLGCLDFYFRRYITLPSLSQCGQPVDDDFCLGMDFYADNHVSEIKVNGVVNYTAPAHPDPYHDFGFQNVTSVNLCDGWKPGQNELQVQVKSCPSAVGFLAQANISANPGIGMATFIEETRQICQGQTYLGYSNPGVYTDTILSAIGCDTIYQLNLTVGQNSFFHLYANICQGESFEGYTNSGIYRDTFFVNFACDSIRELTLNVNPIPFDTITIQLCEGEQFQGFTSDTSFHSIAYAVNNCDTMRTTNLVFRNLTTSVESKTICEGQAYHGHLQSGTFIDTLSAQSGCDSIVFLTLDVLVNSASNILAQICNGEIYEGYSSAGVYQDSFVAQNGCDSIRTLNLDVLSAPFVQLFASICQGESFEGYTISGVYLDSFPFSATCDSTRELILTVVQIPYDTISIQLCQGEQYLGFAHDTMITSVVLSIGSCDTIRTTDLQFFTGTTNVDTKTICEGQSYHGHTSSGAYIDTLATYIGCDSIVNLSLVVLPSVEQVINLSICNGEDYEGYSISGVYQDTFFNQMGCDSIRIIHLVVETQTIDTQQVLLCNEMQLLLNGELILAEGLYFDTLVSALGCDSILGFEVQIPYHSFLGADTALCNSNSFTMTGLSPNTTWFDGTIAQRKTISSSGTYWGVFQDSLGCNFADTISVSFPISYYVPNVFKPSAPVENACFQPYFNDTSISSFQMEIFDRWGSLVYSTSNIYECWDGKVGNTPCNPGVFAYYIILETDTCPSILITGDVTLVR